jgi:cell wall-associated NlpC family hydrolase
MNGRDTMPLHYPAGRRAAPSGVRRGATAMLAGLPAVLLLAALGGCASGGGREVAKAPPSVPKPLHSATTGPAEPLDLRADDLLMRAVGLIGTPYRFGGTTPQQGFDCSGFTSYVYREALGLQLPRTANDQFQRAGATVSRDALAAGDLVFFRQGRGRIDHVGIYVGEGRFIHSPSRGGRVRIDTLGSPYWTRIYQGARRPLEGGPDS